MAPLLSLLIEATLLGIPGGAAYDFVHTVWEKITNRSWRDVYIETFKTSVRDLQPALSKYGSGDIEILSDQLGDVLDRELPLQMDHASYATLSSEAFLKQVVKALSSNHVLILGGHNLSDTDYEQLVSHVVRNAKTIFKNEILKHEGLFKQEILLEFESNRFLLDQIQTYLRLHHNISLELERVIQDGFDQQNLTLGEMARDITSIKQRLGIDRSRSDLVQQINQTRVLDQRPGSILTAGYCRGYRLEPRPEYYFLAQEFSAHGADLKNALLHALSEFCVRPFRADDIYDNGHILCKVSALIQSTQFGVYQLSRSQNRNVYLELGIALGLGKPFVLVKDRDAKVSKLLDGLEYYPIDSYLSLRYDLPEKIKPFLADLAHYQPRISPHVNPQDSVLISHGEIDPVDLSLHLARAIQPLKHQVLLLNAKRNNIPYYFDKEGLLPPTELGKSSGLKLGELVDAIASSRFGIYRIDKKCSPDSFLALGIALSLNKPVILVHEENAGLPSDLLGISALSFRSFSELGSNIVQAIDGIFR